LGSNSSNRLRVAAIDFLNPAPLMWDFEHPPRNSTLAQRYDLHYTQPSLCADDLLANRADLGLIPIASLTPELAIVPGCTIAALDRVRSIQLIVKLDRVPHVTRSLSAADVGTPTDTDSTLAAVRTIAADAASRSSLAYAQILFHKFLGTHPEFLPAPADPIAMLAHADAALLIGDPALLALEARAQIEAASGPCLWLDLAHEWRIRTNLPWVAAVWAVRPESLAAASISADQITSDLQQSRDRGLAHIDSLVAEWTPRIALPPATIRHYLARNIHYTLDQECIATIELFRRYAAEAGILPPLPELRFL
jgi:chorismate dehydratase